MSQGSYSFMKCAESNLFLWLLLRLFIDQTMPYHLKILALLEHCEVVISSLGIAMGIYVVDDLT